MKLGIDLSAIVLNYFDPSKHDFGEIHLHFEVVDKQFFFTNFNAFPVFIVI